MLRAADALIAATDRTLAIPLPLLLMLALAVLSGCVGCGLLCYVIEGRRAQRRREAEQGLVPGGDEEQPTDQEEGEEGEEGEEDGGARRSAPQSSRRARGVSRFLGGRGRRKGFAAVPSGEDEEEEQDAEEALPPPRDPSPLAPPPAPPPAAPPQPRTRALQPREERTGQRARKTKGAGNPWRARKALPGLESEAGVKTGLESAGERILRAGLAGAAEAGLAAVAVHDDAQTVILTGTGSVGVDLE